MNLHLVRNLLAALVLLASGVGALLVPTVAEAQWPQQSCSLRHRIPVTVTATAGTHSAETRVDLDAGNFPADYVFSAGGEDVRVFRTDDLTPVDFVVAGWDAGSRTAQLYLRLPPIGAGGSELVYVYFGDEALPAGDNAAAVFPAAGVRLRSRVSSADPTSAATALAAFAGATTDVDDQVRTSVTGLTNRAIGGANGDFGWCISAVLNVTPATAGNWGFRYGADFGRGGHLYVGGQALEEDWNDDLWWAGNYNRTAETLEGTITLAPGWHRYEALGFEGCCDGAVGFQARAPGGAWQDLSSTNFVIRGAQCINEAANVSIAPVESCTTNLSIAKSVAVDTNSAWDFSIPGSTMRYDIYVENPGQRVDASTLVVTDVFPDDMAVLVTGAGVFAFTDGPVPSGLTFTYDGPASLTDSVEFSADGVNFDYVPAAPADAAVTHIRLRPSGSLNPSAGPSVPGFTVSILGVIQ